MELYGLEPGVEFEADQQSRIISGWSGILVG